MQVATHQVNGGAGVITERGHGKAAWKPSINERHVGSITSAGRRSGTVQDTRKEGSNAGAASPWWPSNHNTERNVIRHRCLIPELQPLHPNLFRSSPLPGLPLIVLVLYIVNYREC